MRLESATVLAQKVIEILRPLCDRVEVAGSIRRQKPEVNDIDIVAIPKYCEGKSPFGTTLSYGPDQTWKELIPQALMKEPLKLLGHNFGSELMRFSFRDNGPQVDIYRARSETWGIILLIRTGSKEHNVKLCILALSRKLQLSAKRGLLCQDSETLIASKTEEEIFAALGMPYVEPKDREVI